MIIVTGASSGLGEAVLSRLRFLGTDAIGVAKEGTDLNIDLRHESEFRKLQMELAGDSIEGIVNCAGVNLLAPFDELNMEAAKELFDINVWAGVRMVQSFLASLTINRGVVCNVVSNASHIPMTHSLAYNMSKAAQDMATRQMAHELTPGYGITVFGISPAKMFGTEMSDYIERVVPKLRDWTPEEAAEYQRKALLTGEEIDPDHPAELIAWLLQQKHRHSHLSGTVIPYGR